MCSLHGDAEGAWRVPTTSSVNRDIKGDTLSVLRDSRFCIWRGTSVLAIGTPGCYRQRWAYDGKPCAPLYLPPGTVQANMKAKDYIAKTPINCCPALVSQCAKSGTFHGVNKHPRDGKKDVTTPMEAKCTPRFTGDASIPRTARMSMNNAPQATLDRRFGRHSVCSVEYPRPMSRFL